MRALTVEIYSLAGPPVYATVGDLDWWRSTEDDPDAILTARLWWDAGRLVGVAWPADDQVGSTNNAGLGGQFARHGRLVPCLIELFNP